MPDLATALAGLFDGGDMTIFQATIDAVGEGTVTIHANGGTFTDVPYMQAGFYPTLSPTIGDPCYVLGRKGWGMLCLGKPAAGPDRAGGDPQTVEWDARSGAVWSTSAMQPGGYWLGVGSDGHLFTSPLNEYNASNQAVLFFDLADLPMVGITLTSASLYMAWTDIAQTDPPRDSFYFELGLHSSASASGPFTKLANLSVDYRTLSVDSKFLSIPLDWVARLIDGTAKGIYIRAEDTGMTLDGLQSRLRLTYV